MLKEEHFMWIITLEPHLGRVLKEVFLRLPLPRPPRYTKVRVNRLWTRMYRRRSVHQCLPPQLQHRQWTLHHADSLCPAPRKWQPQTKRNSIIWHSSRTIILFRRYASSLCRTDFPTLSESSVSNVATNSLNCSSFATIVVHAVTSTAHPALTTS